MDLVIVEHVDDGTLTLHIKGCQHAERATIVHAPTPRLLGSFDKACGTCKPKIEP